MSKQVPQLLKGFRDFLPGEKRERDLVMRTITKEFERFGFDPIETPTLEYKETIMGKYGDEADKLVYSFTDRGEREVAMRYDQTVPTARFIASYQNELAFPFRRYQTQNVFRADKPQRGRFREFTQCDIDIFGSRDALADSEIIACTYAAYKAIGFENVTLQINDREILMSTLKPFATNAVSVFSIIQSLDKLDKMDKENVAGELVTKGLSKEVAWNCLMAMEEVMPSEGLQEIFKLCESLGVDKEAMEFSPTTARGLDYYTGMIFEVRLPGYDVGSVAGGGRYDNLIRDLSGFDIPAVGVAFGFDRTVDAARSMGLLGAAEKKPVLVTIFDENSRSYSASVAGQLRTLGLNTELYASAEKLGKQLKFADKKGIRYVIVAGPEEQQAGKVLLKDLQTSTQQLVEIAQVPTLV